MEVQIIPAFNGDCIFVKILCNGSKKNIMIDGGIARTYPQGLKSKINSIKDANQNIDLLIITHIDDDHIGGIIELFSDVNTDIAMFKSIWFNSGDIISKYFNTKEKGRELKIRMSNSSNMSYKQGITLESILSKTENWHQELLYNKSKIKVFNSNITLLSPDLKSLSKLNKKWEVEKNRQVNMSKQVRNYKTPIRDLENYVFVEDKSVPNGSSIAFLLELDDIKILMLGDSHPTVVKNSLKNLGYSFDNPIQLNLVKVSHHGSKYNTDEDVLRMIICEKYIFSTDGTNHNFPHKEVFAKILIYQKEPTFYFNYRNAYTTSIFTKEDVEQYKFSIVYLESQNYTIKL